MLTAGLGLCPIIAEAPHTGGSEANKAESVELEVIRRPVKLISSPEMNRSALDVLHAGESRERESAPFYGRGRPRLGSMMQKMKLISSSSSLLRPIVWSAHWSNVGLPIVEGT